MWRFGAGAARPIDRGGADDAKVVWKGEWSEIAKWQDHVDFTHPTLAVYKSMGGWGNCFVGRVEGRR